MLFWQRAEKLRRRQREWNLSPCEERRWLRRWATGIVDYEKETWNERQRRREKLKKREERIGNLGKTILIFFDLPPLGKSDLPVRKHQIRNTSDLKRLFHIIAKDKRIRHLLIWDESPMIRQLLNWLDGRDGGQSGLSSSDLGEVCWGVDTSTAKGCADLLGRLQAIEDISPDRA